MTASHTLATEDLTPGYGDRAVIEGLDPTLAAGRITVIVGANVCGKPTLLRAMSRLIAPAAGRPHAAGAPGEVTTEDTVRAVYGMESRVVEDPVSGKPRVLPIGRHHSTAADTGVAAAGSR
ncbi:hypothetical protein SHKM778_33580 [Streptomyces sp. KM77-8]|uniref:ABC transporter domain-containing protein n=1 Tax=Streptomyces haneummycinicus TaxID=3074435 RepID=A0AAT9HHL8_9ACTN